MKSFNLKHQRLCIKQMIIAALILLTAHSKVVSQSNTISISVFVNPPYSTNFEDYVGIGANNVIINLTCSPSAIGLQSFYLAGTLKQTSGAYAPFTIVSPVSPQPPFSATITMSPGEMLSLRGTDLQPYFDESRIQYQNITQQQINTFYATKFIPDGDYVLCLTAHDYDTQAQISPAGSGCSNVFQLRNLEAPRIMYPNCNLTSDAGHIQAGAFQNILFQWSPPIGLPGSANMVYTFQLMEVPVGMNPNQIFQNTTYIPFEVNTGNQTSFAYNTSHPPLQIGKRYALRVRAEDFAYQYGIKNNGYSEVCSFIYGLPNEITNFENATLIPISNLNSGAQLFYFEEYLESTNNILRVQQAVNSNSSNVTHPTEFTISAKIKSTTGDFEISTKQEISIENILQYNTSNMQDVLYHGNKLLKAFGDFEEGKFNFSGNTQNLKNYQVNGSNKFILPAGSYILEIQLMQANGITPISQLNTFNFSVSYPYYIRNIGIPFTVPAEPFNSFNSMTSSQAAELLSVSSGFANRQLFTRFAIEIHSINELNQTVQHKFKLTSLAECNFITNNNTASSTMTFDRLLCVLKQLNANDYKMQTPGSSSWVDISEAYRGNGGKLKLPQGTYRLYFNTLLKESGIALTDPLAYTSFTTTGESSPTFPLEVSTQINNPVHGMDYFVKGQLLQSGSTSYVRAQVSQVNTPISIPFKLRYKIEKIAENSSTEFILNVKNVFIENSTDLFNSSTLSQTLSGNNLDYAFGTYKITNWELLNVINGVSLTDLFPNDELRLPPGRYKLYGWAVNPSGQVNLSSPDQFVEFTLDKALDYEISNERTSILGGLLGELYDVANPPSLKIIKTKDVSTLEGRTYVEIRGITGVLAGKKLTVKQSKMLEGEPTSIVRPSIYHTFTNLASIMARGYANFFLLDGQEVPEEYRMFWEEFDFLPLIKLPPGQYEIIYQTYTPNLSFKLGPADGYRRFFNVEGGALNASTEFNCSGTTPPDFQLRAVYPAANDTLPFRMFPFIVQFCPYSDNFKGVQNGSFTATRLDGSNATSRTGIDNNWPNGPQRAQFNAINGYYEVGGEVRYKVNPQHQITPQMATFLPVYENHNNVLEFPTSIFKRGESYKWASTIPLRFSSGSDEVIRSQSVDNNAFGLGMPRPILNEPAHNSTIESGNIKLKFKKGRVPTSLLPPHDIVQTQKVEGTGGHRVLTYDGIVNEAYMVQISRNAEFTTLFYETPTPVRVSTSYRELISSQIPPPSILDELYGNVEVEKNISESGDYYWRVVWLNNPDKKTDGFYNSSSTYKFTIGTPEQLAENNLNCSGTITNSNAHSWNPSDLKDKNICIGKFTMQVKEIDQLSSSSEPSYMGFGIIRWMDVPFKVVFNDLKINREKQVVGGTARGAKQIPNAITEWIRTNMASLETAFLGAPGENNAEAAQGINTASSVGTGIVNQIVSISNAINGQATMPYGLNFNMTDLEGQNRNFIFALMDLQFTKDNAKMSALLDMDFPDLTLSSILELAATGVTIKPGGFDGDYTFFLPRDKEIAAATSSDYKFGFKGCTYTPGTETQNPEFYNNGTYFKYKKASESTSAYWEAGLGVSLKIKAGDDKILQKITPRATSTSTPTVSDPNYVTFSGQTIITAGGGQSAGFVFTLTSGDKFGFTGVPNLELECNNLVVDISPGANSADLNHTKLNEIKGLTSSSTDENQPPPYTAGNSSLFKGIYFKSISGTYKKVFGDGLTIGLKDLLIDFGDGGFYGTLYARLDAAAKLAGWKIKENEIGVEFKNSLKKAYLKGKIEMPIAQNDPIKYECNIKKENDNYALNLNMKTGEQLKADLLLAKLKLSNSDINVKIPFNDDAISVIATLNGDIAIELPEGANRLGISNPRLIEFNNFKLSSKREDDITNEVIQGWLYVNNGISTGALNREANPETGGGSTNCFSSSSGSTGSTSTEETISLAGFGATLGNFGLKFEPQSPGSDGTLKVKLGMKFNLDLRLGPTPTPGSSEDHFSITAGGEISLFGGNLTYNTNDGFGFVLSPDVKLGDCFRVSGKIGPAEIADGSGLEFFDNPTKGKGFDLQLQVKLSLGEGSINPDVAMQLVVGSKGIDASKFKYFGLGISVSGFTLPVAPPFNLTGLGGGLAVNMKSSTSFDSEELVCSGAGPSVLGNLTPDKGAFYFFVKGTGNVTSDEVVKLCLKIQAEIQNGTLKDLSIVADAKFLAKEPANDGLLYGKVTITYTDEGTSKTFELTAELQTLAPLPRANVVFALNIEKSVNQNPLWFVALGKPASRCSIENTTSAGIATASLNIYFYFISGNDLDGAGILEERPMPQLLQQAINGKGNVNDQRNKDKIDSAKLFYDQYRQTLINLFGEQRNSGNTTPGIAMGAELTMELNVDFFLLYFDFSLIAGFNLAMIELPAGTVCGSITNPGINNWYAVGDLYAGMSGDLGIQVNLFFYKGKISLFNFGLAAILNGAGPNPWYAAGTVFARGQVLGGLIDVDMEMEFSYGKPCPETLFDLNDLKIINDVSPAANGVNDASYRVAPSAGFNLAVTTIREPLDNLNPNDDRKSRLEIIRTYEVKYKEGNQMIVRNFCFPLTRFEIYERPKASSGEFRPIFSDENNSFYNNGGGRPFVSADGKSATANLNGGTLFGDYAYEVRIEAEVLEFRDNKWLVPKDRVNNRDVYRRRVESYSLGEVDNNNMIRKNNGPYRFITGPAPTNLGDEYVLYTTPVIDQRNFHMDDHSSIRTVYGLQGQIQVPERNWKISFTTYPDYLLGQPLWVQEAYQRNRRLHFKKFFYVKFISEDRDVSDEVEFNPTNRQFWQGNLPNLLPNKVYRLEFTSRWKAMDSASKNYLADLENQNQSIRNFARNFHFTNSDNLTAGTATINETQISNSYSSSFTENEVYSLHFRTSIYPTFHSKLQAINFSSAWQGDVLRLTSPSAALIPESFDVVELSPYKVLESQSFYFPPLYQIRFLPNDNRLAPVTNKPNQTNSNSNVSGSFSNQTGMASLFKLYKNGFLTINNYLRDFGENHGISFLDAGSYQTDLSINAPRSPVRISPNSAASRYNDNDNALAYFPAGAIRVLTNNLAGKLTSSEKYKGYLTRYRPKGSNSQQTKISKQPSVFTIGNSSVSTNNAHLTISIEIQQIVNNDVRLYREILFKSRTEMERLLRNQFNLSNESHTRTHLDEMIIALKGMVLNQNTTGGSSFPITHPIISRDNLMRRLYFQNMTAFSADPPWGVTLDHKIFALNRIFHNYRVTTDIHPFGVFTTSGGMSGILDIEKPFVRMYHALITYKNVFNRELPTESNFNAFFSQLGIDATTLFKDLSSIKLSVRQSSGVATMENYISPSNIGLISESSFSTTGIVNIPITPQPIPINIVPVFVQPNLLSTPNSGILQPNLNIIKYK